MGDVLGVILGSSAPGPFDPERARPVARLVLHGLPALDREMARQPPDALVVVSAGWLTTFYHYVAGAPHFRGDPAAGRVAGGTGGGYRGDPALARAIVVAGQASQVPVVLTEEPAPPLDDATATALRSLASAADVPIVALSICQLADLAQSLRWGRAIAAAARGARRRALLVAAGPAAGPRRCGGRDEALLALFAAGRPGSSPAAGTAAPAAPEPAGRPLALLLGALGPDPRGPGPGPRGERALTLVRN
jgi:hypothetical protein